MRVRRTTADGDICFGHNANDYLVNTPEAVAQNVRTRLALWQGQWFIDTDEGSRLRPGTSAWSFSLLGESITGGS